MYTRCRSPRMQPRNADRARRSPATASQQHASITFPLTPAFHLHDLVGLQITVGRAVLLPSRDPALLPCSSQASSRHHPTRCLPPPRRTTHRTASPASPPPSTPPPAPSSCSCPTTSATAPSPSSARPPAPAPGRRPLTAPPTPPASPTLARSMPSASRMSPTSMHAAWRSRLRSTSSARCAAGSPAEGSARHTAHHTMMISCPDIPCLLPSAVPCCR